MGKLTQTARPSDPPINFTNFNWDRFSPLLLALAAGGAIGLAMSSSHWTLTVTAAFMGVCLLIAVRYPRRGLLLALILHPFINFLYLNLQIPGSIPDLSLTRAVISLIVLVLVARSLTGRQPLQPFGALELTMGLAVTGLIVAGFRAQSSISSALQWVLDMFLMPYAVYFIAKNTTLNAIVLRRVLWAVAIIGACNGLYGVYTQLTGNILFVEGGQVFGDIWYTENLRIMRGLLDSPHVFGLVFSIAIPIQFYLMLKAPRREQRILAGLMLVVTLAALFLTFKRTAWIATLVSLLVIQVYFPRFRRLLLFSVALIGFVTWLYADEIAASEVVTDRVGDNAATLNGRISLWQTAGKYVGDEPWLGYGLFSAENYTSLQVLESQYLWLLLDGGLLVFVPYLLVFMLFLRLIHRLWRAQPHSHNLFVERDLLGTFLGVLVAYLISMTTVVMNHDFPHLLLFLLAGAILGSQEALTTQASLPQSAPPMPLTAQARSSAAD